MMKAADLWDSNDFALGRRFNEPWRERVAIQGEMRPGRQRLADNPEYLVDRMEVLLAEMVKRG